MRYRYDESDVFALPGGNPDLSETLPETLVRELREELCIEIEVNQMVLMGEVFNPKLKKDTLHIVFRGSIIGGLPVLDPAETTALEVVWMPITDISRHFLYPNVGSAIQHWALDQLPHSYIGNIDQPYFG